MTAPAAAQNVSLERALDVAMSNAWDVRAADADVRSRSAQQLLPARGILPSVRVEAGWMRTTDPIGAFGTALRQRVITEADFMPQSLNYPDPVSNYGASLVLEQPLLNADAHLGRRAAARATEAARAGAAWARSGTALSVVHAYYGGVLTAERVATLEAARDAAQSHVRRAQLLAEQGVVTKSDAMLARVKLREVEAQLVQARGDAGLAARRLAVLLGTPDDTSWTLPAALPSAEQLRDIERIGWRAAEAPRPDVAAAGAAHDAARLDAQRARAALLPRLNAMARYDWNSADAPFRGDENWSVGVVASWSLFSGAAEIADARGSSARAEAARVQLEGARARADLELAEAANGWSVALERLALAEESVEQAAEAHRITARMYAGGLATVTELLGASAVETEARLRRSAAQFDVIAAAARRLQVLGRDVRELTPILDSRVN